MDYGLDVPDATDWLDTPLAGLARVESALRCQICKDIYDNPVITTCCHTFCSLCIRRCLSVEGKCPTCRSSDQVLKLRRNWAVQELVDSFVVSRREVLEFARRSVKDTVAEKGEMDAGEPASKKRKVDVSQTDTMRRTRSQSKRGSNDASSQSVVVEDTEADDDGEYQPDDGLVACPVCGRRMRNEDVYYHLDRCTGSRPKPATIEATGSLRFPAAQKVSSITQPPKRLPTINYTLLKEYDLRRKLRELGIPDWGPKPLLQKRHTEWLNLWNANCDAKAPKSKRELLRELDVWERTQGGQASGGSGAVMRKDFDSSAWSAAHGDEFKSLIANARMRRERINGETVDSGEVAEGDSAGENAMGPSQCGQSNDDQGHTHPELEPESASQQLPQPLESRAEINSGDDGQNVNDTSHDNSQRGPAQHDNSFGHEHQVIVVDDAVA